MRRVAILLFLLATARAAAQDGRASDMGALLGSRNWPAADALAAMSPDPVAPQLVRYLRLLSKDAAGVDEIDRFLTAWPEWPMQVLLTRRYDEALAAERDDATARAACLRRRPASAGALLRCADAATRLKQDGADDARAAWLAGITEAPAEVAFMRRWSPILTAQDQHARFDRLAWTAKPDPGGALARQAVRVAPADRPATEARLALRRDDPAAGALYAVLPEPARTNPGLVLDLLRWQRRAGHEDDAVRYWTDRGQAAEAIAPADRQHLFTDERTALARSLLRRNDPAANAQAYAVADTAYASPDLDFLAGWIALRRLAQPDLAAPHFRSIADTAHAAISQARAHYWLARTLTAQSKPADAEYRLAAAWPTTYYGQLAALALGDTPADLEARIAHLTDPAWDEARAIDVAADPLGRAATLLMRWNQPRQARPFLEHLETRASDPAGRAIVARFADELGLPDAAVAAARRAGLHGIMLPNAGWPDAADPPDAQVERNVALGLIRQESSFDATIGSPVGAQGLMQLMPATAGETARRLGQPAGPLTDPAINMRLGTAYLAGLLGRFGALPPALAGYNAGPGRTREWLAAFGDPATGAIDPIDWIELIPFGETRDYVQRVVENVVIYRAHHQAGLPHPVLRWASSAS